MAGALINLVVNIKVHTESWILVKILKFAQQFSRPGKSLENGDKVQKNGGKSWFFFTFQCYNKCFISEFFSFWSNLIQSHPVHLQSIMKTLCSCVFLRSLSSLEKEIIVLEKSLEKVLNFGSKNLYKPWSNLLFFFSLNKIMSRNCFSLEYL